LVELPQRGADPHVRPQRLCMTPEDRLQYILRTDEVLSRAAPGADTLLPPEASKRRRRERLAEVDGETLLAGEPRRCDLVLDVPLTEDFHRALVDSPPFGEQRGGRVPLHEQAVDPEAAQADGRAQSDWPATNDECGHPHFIHGDADRTPDGPEFRRTPTGNPNNRPHGRA